MKRGSERERIEGIKNNNLEDREMEKEGEETRKKRRGRGERQKETGS